MANALICSNCGTVAKPKSVIKGNLIVEIILWVCFLFPGLVYSIWRLSTRAKVCPSCNAPNMLQLHSPLGKKLQKQLIEGNRSLPPPLF